MKRAIYSRGVKIADGIVIKEGCTEYEIASFALLLLTKYGNTAFRDAIYGKVRSKNFVEKLLLIKILPSFTTEYITWITNKGHMVSVLRERKDGTYYIVIGEDKSENFYPMIIETANTVIPRGLVNELPFDFPKKENYEFRSISRSSIFEYIETGEIVMCSYRNHKLYIYDDTDCYDYITANMLLYGDWYVYTE